jgi:pimeloyl-ACP methyl ester carboxylesterase
METIRSNDGTLIAYEKSGQGAPLVLVHGTSADHTRWKPVLAAFEAYYSVYAMDRRGRGSSGDTQPYNIQREYEDIAALIDVIPEPVILLGHSYGGLCALESAFLTKNIHRLILYEPAIMPPGESEISPKTIIEIQTLLAAGDRERVVETFMREVAQMPDDDLKLMRSLPSWTGRVAAADTILREMTAPASYRIQPERLKQIQAPSLLLLGGSSPAHRKTVADQLHAGLSTSRIAVMPGQQHTAMNTAPGMFINEVMTFLADPILTKSIL